MALFVASWIWFKSGPGMTSESCCSQVARSISFPNGWLMSLLINGSWPGNGLGMAWPDFWERNPIVRWFFSLKYKNCLQRQTLQCWSQHQHPKGNMLLSAADVSLFGWFSFLVAKSFTVDHRMGSMKNFIRTSHGWKIHHGFSFDQVKGKKEPTVIYEAKRATWKAKIHTSGYAWNVISLYNYLYEKHIYIIDMYVYIYKSSIIYVYMTDNTNTYIHLLIH